MGLKNSVGTFQLPLALALLVVATAGMGIWRFLHQWKTVTRLQMKLDRCVGRTSHEFKTFMATLDSSNRRIKALRATLMSPVSAVPGAQAGAEAALLAQYVLQEAHLARWKLKQVKWIAMQGCKEIHGLAFPLPDPDFLRLPPDAVGPRPLQWKSSPPTEFRIRLAKSPRASAALLRRERDDIERTFSGWKASWTSFY